MPKIMVVEDDQSLREIYSIRLTAEGFDLVSAGDGEEALAIAVKEKPDLIISDVMMPKISGFDMLDILRSTPETKNIKVIMMTALSSDDQRKRGENLGADKYLVKSQVGIEDVIAAVREILGTSAPAPTTETSAIASETPGGTSETTATTDINQTMQANMNIQNPAQEATIPQAPAPQEAIAQAPVAAEAAAQPVAAPVATPVPSATAPETPVAPTAEAAAPSPSDTVVSPIASTVAAPATEAQSAVPDATSAVPSLGTTPGATVVAPTATNTVTPAAPVTDVAATTPVITSAEAATPAPEVATAVNSELQEAVQAMGSAQTPATPIEGVPISEALSSPSVVAPEGRGQDTNALFDSSDLDAISQELASTPLDALDNTADNSGDAETKASETADAGANATAEPGTVNPA